MGAWKNRREHRHDFEVIFSFFYSFTYIKGQYWIVHGGEQSHQRREGGSQWEKLHSLSHKRRAIACSTIYNSCDFNNLVCIWITSRRYFHHVFGIFDTDLDSVEVFKLPIFAPVLIFPKKNLPTSSPHAKTDAYNINKETLDEAENRFFWIIDVICCGVHTPWWNWFSSRIWSITETKHLCKI